MPRLLEALRLQAKALAMAMCLVAPVVAHPSMLGPTGGLNTPNPRTLPPEKTQVALHVEGINEFSPHKLSVETNFDLSPKVLVGVYDNIELGLEQTIRVN